MQVFFALLLLLIGLASGLAVILKREPMQGALFLVMTLFTIATTYVLLGAEFLAAVQVIIYAGAIMVLIVFVIQLTGTDSLPIRIFQKQTPLAILVSIVILAELVLALFSLSSHTPKTVAIAEGPVQGAAVFSKELFTTYLFPFEVASVLLLIAVIGTVLLAQQRDIRQ